MSEDTRDAFDAALEGAVVAFARLVKDAVVAGFLKADAELEFRVIFGAGADWSRPVMGG